MRKSIIPMAVAIVSALSLPAQAAKFNCIFYGQGIPPTPACTVDTANPKAKCEHTYSGNLKGTCDGAGSLLRCVFHTEPLTAEVQQDLATAAPTAFLPAPGMLAGGIVETSTKFFLAGYRENRTSPEVDARCTPAP